MFIDLKTLPKVVVATWLRSSIISPFCSSPATAPFKAQRHSQLALRFHQKDCSNVTVELQLFLTGASQTMVTTATPHRVTTGSGKLPWRPGSFNRQCESVPHDCNLLDPAAALLQHESFNSPNCDIEILQAPLLDLQ
ncbi:UNVERIFIED_CONTAM: hypothetical protein FKN15_003250 [Acipenser sinensis]